MKIDEVRPRPGLVRGAGVTVRFPDHHQAIGVREWHWAQQYGVDDAEDRGRHPDAERQGEHGGDRKARRATKQTKGVADVLSHVGLDVGATGNVGTVHRVR